MRYVSLSVDRSRIRVQRKIWPGLEVFEGVTGCDSKNFRLECIPKSYRNAAVWFVEQGLGRETVFMQDDVWMPHGPGFETRQAKYETSLLIFGQTEKGGGVAPKAFSATPEVWVKLAQVWTGEGRIIPAWMPVVEEYGLVLDVCRGLGG